MNLGRIFATALARRVAYVLVALVVAQIALCSKAHAQTSKNYADIGAAKVGCQAEMAAIIAANPGRNAQPYDANQCVTVYGWGTQYFQCQFKRQLGTPPSGPLANGVCAIQLHQFPMANTCKSRASIVSTPTYQMRNSTIECRSGCEVVWFNNGDGTYTGNYGADKVCNTIPDCASIAGLGYYLNTSSGHCELPESKCKANERRKPDGTCEQTCPIGMHLGKGGACERDENECPAGNVRSPAGTCLPGDGQCAAGEARRPNGTCGKDDNGDGVADDDDDDPENDSEKETFSGGDNCDNPPSCSGGPIMCGMARIQWRIDCNTRRNVNIAGGSCSAMPICTGDKCNAMEYASLIQQWKTGCELEKLNAKPSSSGDGQQPEWTKVTGDGTAGAGADAAKPHRTVGLGLGMLDSGGFLGGGSCPQYGSVDLGIFGDVNLDAFPWICDMLAAIKIVMIGLGAFLAFGILAGRWF